MLDSTVFFRRGGGGGTTSFPGLSPTRPTEWVGRVGENPGNEVGGGGRSAN